MATLTWDKLGDRIFQAGVDRGVLYLNDGKAVPWNGLTSVEDNTTKEGKSFFLDGVKYLEIATPGDFSGVLKAITYPQEFDSVNGVLELAPGFSYYDQPSKTFGLAYRTRVGNDIEGVDLGYKIHILYNLVASPESIAFVTLQDPSAPVEFSWALNGTPPKVRQGYRPTVHVSIDSTSAETSAISVIEDVLYGTETSAPRLPGIDELTDFFRSLGALIIIDNGDGTWTAIDSANDYITMLDDTTFQIDNADVVYLDATTYQISNTTHE